MYCGWDVIVVVVFGDFDVGVEDWGFSGVN